MPPNHFESEVESFLEGSHGDRTHNKQQADHHTVTPLCGTLLHQVRTSRTSQTVTWGFSMSHDIRFDLWTGTPERRRTFESLSLALRPITRK